MRFFTLLLIICSFQANSASLEEVDSELKILKAQAKIYESRSKIGQDEYDKLATKIMINGLTVEKYYVESDWGTVGMRNLPQSPQRAMNTINFLKSNLKIIGSKKPKWHSIYYDIALLIAMNSMVLDKAVNNVLDRKYTLEDSTFYAKRKLQLITEEIRLTYRPIELDRYGIKKL